MFKLHFFGWCAPLLLLVCVSPPASRAALCSMRGCSCTRDAEDNSILTISCPGVGFKAFPSLKAYPNLTQLNLEGNRIGVLRTSDLDPVRRTLILLDLNDNGLRTIEEGALRDLPELQHIMLSRNSLRSLPAEVFANKKEISTLDLSHNSLTSFPAGFASVKAYGTFFINDNPIGNLRSGLFAGNLLTMITTLDISNIGMTDFDPEDAGFGHLTGTADKDGMTHLYLNGNQIPEINSKLVRGLPISLNTLSMRFCGIQTIRADSFFFGVGPFLRRLLLDGNNLGVLRRTPFRGMNLELLDLANCNISSIRRDAFHSLYVKELYLEDNSITDINKFEFFDEEVNDGIRGLELLDLGNCSIRRILGTPFNRLTDLKLLDLVNNDLDNEGLGKSLRSHGSLETLDLSGNRLTSVPNMPDYAFPRLSRLFVSHNQISSLSRAHLANMTGLEILVLNSNPLEGFPEEDDTFADTQQLEVLKFDHTLLTRLPNVKYLPNLLNLHADHARLTHLPEDLCHWDSDLAVLEMQGNRLTEIPTLSCRNLVDLDVSHNLLSSVHADLLKDMPRIRALNLRNNQIQSLDQLFFENSIDMQDLQLGANQLEELPVLSFMPYLERINLSHNCLIDIPEGAFVEQVKLDSLYLNDNHIRQIHSRSFPVHGELKTLNLSRNSELSRWELPQGGFPLMARLFLEDMFSLHQVPHTLDIPRVHELRLTYSYHCCIWEKYLAPPPNISVEEEGSGRVLIITQPTAPEPTFPSLDHCLNIEGIINFYKELGICVTIDPETCEATVSVNDTDSNNNFGPIQTQGKTEDEIIEAISSRIGVNVVFRYRQKVDCTPHDNPLTPCEYLLGSWVLKVAIWAVWILALLGNGTVLFIGIAAQEKLESNELLICNLAFADFCMGVYLAFLAIVDVRTFGQSFYQAALDWQLGPGCKAAGFIAIFSSELSIFLLVVLTLERVYSIYHAFNQKESSKRKVVILLCMVGWVVSAVLALLPLVGVNSYDRVAVCLPYLTEKAVDKFYIGFILTLNFVGFLIILFSYVYIYGIACRNAPASDVVQRRKDMLTAASKIAVVIVTAFLCWAPIAVIGYMALADISLVDAEQAKYFIVFVYPLNACVNPFIYAFFTKRFRGRVGTIFRRSKDKVTSFPPNHQMRLQRTQSAFASEYPLTRVSSTGSNRTDDLPRYKRPRANSVVVQMVDTSLCSPSPTASFHPPSGCNLGRRASLPPGFGSTLNVAGGRGGEREHSHLPHYHLPFRLASQYYGGSSNNSSLPNLQEVEEFEADLAGDGALSSSMEVIGNGNGNPLTSSDESNLRRLSVVKEEESEADLVAAICGSGAKAGGGNVFEQEEEDALSVSSSSSEEYSDASDSMEQLGAGLEGGTDLDCLLSAKVTTTPANSVTDRSHLGREELPGSGPRHLLDEVRSKNRVAETLAVPGGTGSSHRTPWQAKARSCENIYSTTRPGAPFLKEDVLSSSVVSKSSEMLASPSDEPDENDITVPLSNLNPSGAAEQGSLTQHHAGFQSHSSTRSGRGCQSRSEDTVTDHPLSTGNSNNNSSSSSTHSSPASYDHAQSQHTAASPHHPTTPRHPSTHSNNQPSNPTTSTPSGPPETHSTGGQPSPLHAAETCQTGTTRSTSQANNMNAPCQSANSTLCSRETDV